MTTQVPLSYNGTSQCFSIECCLFTEGGKIVFTAFALTYCLLCVPASLYILFVALQSWWQQRSSSTTAATSQADVFAFHIAAITVIGVFGCLLVCYGLHENQPIVMFGGVCCWLFSWYGETFFHTLTCLERYLAVAHPIMYLKLKSERGIFIRNISFVCVWLFCLLRTFMIYSPSKLVFDVFGQIFSLIVAIVCNFFVFHILIRPIPGKQGRDVANRTKQKAFIIVMAILVALTLRFVSNLALYSYYLFNSTGEQNCFAIFASIWFNIPSSLVIPSLFLHRAWK